MTVSANPQFRTVWHIAILLSCLFLGFIFGCSIYEPTYLSMMRSALDLPVSIVGVFVCIYCPLLCTFFSFTANKPIVIYIVCFIKAAGLGFSYFLVSRLFTSASWLIRLLFLFSDSFNLFMLFSLWMMYFLNHSAVNRSSYYTIVLLATLIIFIDFIIVFPVIQGLF